MQSVDEVTTCVGQQQQRLTVTRGCSENSNIRKQIIKRFIQSGSSGSVNSAETVVFLDASVKQANKMLQKEGKEQGHILHGSQEFSRDPPIHCCYN